MRRDLFIGIFLSVAIHAGIAYFGNTPPKRPPKPPKDDAVAVTIVMPPIEPDTPDEAESSDQAAPTDMAPPMQTDIPSVVTQDSFVQVIEPPPPDNLKMNTGIVKISTGRNGLTRTEIFDISKLDRAPQPISRQQPNYPFDLKRQGIEGSVVVDFIINTSGTVQDAFALSSTNRDFEAPAVAAVSKWKFRPGRKDGHVVNSHAQVPVVFKIAEDDNE